MEAQLVIEKKPACAELITLTHTHSQPLWRRGTEMPSSRGATHLPNPADRTFDDAFTPNDGDLKSGKQRVAHCLLLHAMMIFPLVTLESIYRVAKMSTGLVAAWSQKRMPGVDTLITYYRKARETICTPTLPTLHTYKRQALPNQSLRLESKERRLLA
jgi:hypothetical protein